MSFATAIQTALDKVQLRNSQSGWSLKKWWHRGTQHNDSQVYKRPSGKGEVFIVGAGPGDPELLTLKAYRLLQTADVVLFDWLVSEELLRLIPACAIRQFVGKRCGQHSFEQQTICNLMVEHARLGRKVVRLKGGDPSVFGRVSEECEALQLAEIPFAIVPGITAASGMSAYSGMPLTDRRYAQSVRFITATLKNPEEEPDWSGMVAQNTSHKTQDTLVFYMGLKRIAVIAQRLMSHGMAADMPCAIVDQATQQTQKVIHGQLDSIAHKLSQHDIEGPALLVVGRVTEVPWPVNLNLLHKEASLFS
ncbi:uroporphyrinogen-III C-methyltransferase [Planctobacterium marinum]|uniref:uroporphyrinogen-III C-methyltransferase n=1 Tax=Planctobacterium marinum TaxID=1631968 RepID=A0AA48KTW1_9ALTE|nr:hypothetical protein MACH26_41180 [Planctobacterium marinum]